MDILKFFAFILFGVLFFSGKGLRAAECESTREFVSTVDYLRKQKSFTLPDNEILKTALLVSENCNGASRRFQQMLSTLVAAGVDHEHARHFAIGYSQEDSESVEAFLSLFQGLVLEKKFNLPFYEAFETAKFFAESSKGNKAVLKKDFLGFLGFCFEDSNGIMLSLEQCRSLSLKYLKLHSVFPKGVFQDFKSLFVFLRDQKETGLPIANALAVTQTVLENGPGSRKNFIDSYKYGLYQLNMKPGQSLALALKLASFTKSKNEK